MEFKKEVLENKKVKLTIELNAEEWGKYLTQSFEKNKGKFNVQGFRAGKAPRNVIERTYGKLVFADDALDFAFDASYRQYIEENKDFDPVGKPQANVEKLTEDSVTLSITTDVKPEVKLGAYTGLGVELKAVEVSEEEVLEEIKKAQEKSARLVENHDDIQKGDSVTFDFSGSVDGVKFDGGTAEDFELEIGSGQFIPGFEDQMIGLKKGEQKDITVTFPEDYGAKDLAGKEAVFALNIKNIRTKELPELNDEFASNISEFETLEEYKADVKKQITARKEEQNKQEYETKLIEAAVKNAEVEIPESMVEEQIDNYIHNFEHQLMHQGLKLQDYLMYLGTTEEKLREERKEDAKETVKTQLVFDAIIEKENLKVEDADIDEVIKERAEKAGKTVEEMKKALNQNVLMQIANNIIVNKVIETLKK